MEKLEFLQNLADVLQTDEELTYNTVLEDLEEWDSLSKMAVIAFIDKEFGQKISFNDVKNFVTVEDIAKKAGV